MALVAKLVRNKGVGEALTLLKFTPKRSAPVLAKLIASAKANAENNFQQDPQRLVIQKLLVEEGPTFKRGRPISRGRTHRIKKRTSRILVELGVSQPVATKQKGRRKAQISTEKLKAEDSEAAVKQAPKPRERQATAAKPQTGQAQSKESKLKAVKKVSAEVSSRSLAQ